MFRKSPYRIFYRAITIVVLALIIAASGGTVQPTFASTLPKQATATPGTLDLSIVSVQKGKSVTIQVANWPAYKEFHVLMNKIGTKGIDGTKVGTGKTGKDGSYEGTFAIPTDLRDHNTIAIRIETTDNSGYYAYNWFTNSNSNSSPSAPSVSGITNSDNLIVESVEEDVSIDIKAKNLPRNTVFTIWFDWKNRRNNVNSLVAGTIKSDKDGKIVATIKIPRELKDHREMAIRLQSTGSSEYTVSRWFLNETSNQNKGSGYPSGYDQGIPYILIQAVVQNETVTIKAYNLPPRKEFYVYMGKMGSKGIKGTKVGTEKIGKNGTLTASFEIPEKFHDEKQIAIRLQASDSSGIYVYSWFNNKTWP